MGFCTPEQSKRFLEMGASNREGDRRRRYHLDQVLAGGQRRRADRRLERRIDDPRKIWKLSELDLNLTGAWYDYSRARDAMFAATDTVWAPGSSPTTRTRGAGRLNIISHLLSRVPDHPLPLPSVTLPTRQAVGDYVEPDLPLHYIPAPY